MQRKASGSFSSFGLSFLSINWAMSRLLNSLEELVELFFYANFSKRLLTFFPYAARFSFFFKLSI